MYEEVGDYIRRLSEVTAEKERIGAELSVATRIQANMLPSIFPPFPDRKDVDIYATMHPAKEVGGDFYDFFLIDPMHLLVFFFAAQSIDQNQDSDLQSARRKECYFKPPLFSSPP